MHELSIALSLVEGAEEHARRLGESRVVALHVKVGPLSGVVPDALLLAYGVASEGTMLEGSRLAIEQTAVMIHCSHCNRETAPESLQSMSCSECGHPPSRVVQGQELELVALEVDE